MIILAIFLYLITNYATRNAIKEEKNKEASVMYVNTDCLEELIECGMVTEVDVESYLMLKALREHCYEDKQLNDAVKVYKELRDSGVISNDIYRERLFELVRSYERDLLV